MRHVDPAQLEGGDQMVEPGQGLGVERLGIVPRVVEEAVARTDGHIQVAEPDQVDAQRASRSAIASARSGSRKAVCGIRLTPRNRARRLDRESAGHP